MKKAEVKKVFLDWLTDGEPKERVFMSRERFDILNKIIENHGDCSFIKKEGCEKCPLHLVTTATSVICKMLNKMDEISSEGERQVAVYHLAKKEIMDLL